MSRTLWFSPVPPGRTDVARYSARVIPHLAQLIDLDVVRPDGMPEGRDLLSSPIGNLNIRELNASRICVYNVGNNPVFHGQILQMAMRHPGIVVLHDRSMQDLCYAILGNPLNGDYDASSYRAAMSRWYGRKGSEAARSASGGEMPVSQLSQEFPLFEVALQRALGAVTHNPEVAEEIAERFPGMPVATLHLPYDQQMSTRSAHTLGPDRPIRLVMFGYLNPNRRLCEFLRAWAQSPWKDRFELDLAGEMNNGPEARAVMTETGLCAQIRDHGFLPDHQLDVLISQAHLVLNLRNPTMGEASGSQLRIWANGAASVVSDTGWYRQLPEGSVLRIGTDNEHCDLLRLLEDLAEYRVDLSGIGRRGAECLAACDPSTYASSLFQWLEEERGRMFTRWAETALIEATARTYALCTPLRFVPKIPERLLA
jgi:hypothetical protein